MLNDNYVKWKAESIIAMVMHEQSFPYHYMYDALL